MEEIQELGIGEIVINSIDNDGCMSGYDFSLIDDLKPNVIVPMSVLGGAGSLNDLKMLIVLILKNKLINFCEGE